jgi:hypothetical protein
MNDADDIVDMITGATKKWTKQKKAEERHLSARHIRKQRMQSERQMHLTEALTWIVEGEDGKTVMEVAYLKASANGTLPANARQVMYAARPMLQELTSKTLSISPRHCFLTTSGISRWIGILRSTTEAISSNRIPAYREDSARLTSETICG